ncbi:MAG: hypothetical protein AAFN50_13360 [Pseudomonadota bacterium]
MPIIRLDSDRAGVAGRRATRSLIAVAALLFMAGCQTLPEDAFRLTESALEMRQMQSRVYDDVSELQILSASSAVLQDLGYAIDEIERDLGVLSASKRADASNGAEIVGKIALDIADCILTILLGCENNSYQSAKDVQDVRMTLVVLPDPEQEMRHRVRLTMQRFVWDRAGSLYEQETIDDPLVYQAFFDKLAKSVFLEKEGV